MDKWKLSNKNIEYKKVTMQIIKAVANTIDAKDIYTNGHSQRVAEYSKEMALRLGMPLDEAELVYSIALLHDIGKIGIPDRILNKPGKLSVEEFEIMKLHPKIGYEILKEITTIPNITNGAYYHHEHYDGTGYPCGLSGDDIPIEARLIAVADMVDTLNSIRPYRTPVCCDDIATELEKCKGTQFDSKIADIMLEMIKEGYVNIIHENSSHSMLNYKNILSEYGHKYEDE